MSLTGSPSSLLATCPHHLNLASLTFSAISIAPHLLISSFLYLSFSETPKIHLSIRISVILIKSSSLFRNVQHSAPYSNTGLSTVLQILHFSFLGIFLSQMTPDISLHFIYAVFTLCLTAFHEPPSASTTIPRYLKQSTCANSLPLVSTILATVSCFLSITKVSDFSAFTFKPPLASPLCHFRIFSCISSSVLPTNAMSSARINSQGAAVRTWSVSVEEKKNNLDFIWTDCSQRCF